MMVKQNADAFTARLFATIDGMMLDMLAAVTGVSTPPDAERRLMVRVSAQSKAQNHEQLGLR
jgi:hypothetical protein